jgi:AAA15 family ATPase/GTPase
MLLRFKIKNFLSFQDETTFDMFPNPKRENLIHHVYTNMKVPLLKQAAIYGANASGKSNFIKAVNFLHEFVISDCALVKRFGSNVGLDGCFFQLTAEVSPVIEFEIEFFFKEQYYVYYVAIEKKKEKADSKIELREKLLISGLGKEDDVLIFDRNGAKINATTLQNKSAVEQLLEKNPTSSLLPLNNKFPIFAVEDENVQNVYRWFYYNMMIFSIEDFVQLSIVMMSEYPDVFGFANSVFAHIGIGTDALEINKIPFDEWIASSKVAVEVQQRLENADKPIANVLHGRNVRSIIIEKGKKIVQEILFNQSGQDGFCKKMDILSQSDGTVRLLLLVPALYSAINYPATIFVDEIENSIHPNLMIELLRLYADSDSKGQLIFTTHEEKLLNQSELIRPDEVWFTEKNEGSTTMYSLNDFKLHNTKSIANGYLDGRYGAVPYIGEIGTSI